MFTIVQQLEGDEHSFINLLMRGLDVALGHLVFVLLIIQAVGITSQLGGFSSVNVTTAYFLLVINSVPYIEINYLQTIYIILT